MAKKKVIAAAAAVNSASPDDAYVDAQIKFVDSTTVNEELLITLVSETRKNGFINMADDNLFALETAGYAEVNRNNETSKGFAWRATDKGIDYIMGTNSTKTVKTPAVKHVFAIGAFNPANVIAKVKGQRGRTSKYDFEALEAGQYIFVPATAEKPNPATSLASSVIGVNAKHAVPTGAMKEVSRKPKGGTEKVTKLIPETTQVKFFELHAYTENGVAGAAIVRMK